MKWALIPLLLLAGCSHGPKVPSAPKYEDPFVRLYEVDYQTRVLQALTSTSDYAEFLRRVGAPSSSASVPLDQAFEAKRPVALVPSENAVVFLEYARSYGLNPQYLVDRIVGLLRQRLPGLVLLEDIASSHHSRMKTTVLVDIQARFAENKGDSSLIEVSYFFFDERMNPISRILARSERIGSFPLTEGNYQKLCLKVATDLRGKVENLLGLELE